MEDFIESALEVLKSPYFIWPVTGVSLLVLVIFLMCVTMPKIGEPLSIKETYAAKEYLTGRLSFLCGSGRFIFFRQIRILRILRRLDGIKRVLLED